MLAQSHGLVIEANAINGLTKRYTVHAKPYIVRPETNDQTTDELSALIWPLSPGAKPTAPKSCAARKLLANSRPWGQAARVLRPLWMNCSISGTHLAQHLQIMLFM